jgi:hypothetical protein
VRDMERQPVHVARLLTPAQRDMLRALARDTWRFFSESVTPEGPALPPDNVQIDPPAPAVRRTSPTNIGLYLLSCVAARQLGLIDPADCAYGYRASKFKTEWKGRYVITAVTYRLSRTPQPRLDYGGVRKALENMGVGMGSQTHGHPRPCPARADIPSGIIGGKSLPEREGPTAASEDALRDGRGRSEAEAVCEDIPAPLKSIRIRGLMGMASNTEDRAQVEGEFARIEALYKRIKASGMEDFDTLSIGMSGDWPLAVQHGATIVRIGTDIFGPREY